MIKLPYGIANFDDIIEQDYYYVDKTKYIEILENYPEKYILFIRPRKFGKSLFVSILDFYYNIRYKDKFNKLFGKYYIGKHPTKLHNQYLVLRFHFSGINTETKESTYNGFKNNVVLGLEKFYTETGWEEVRSIIDKDNTPEGYLGKSIELVRNKGRKIYVLIDEYDHFANELVSFQVDLFKNIVSKNGFVRKFYEELKEGTNSVIDRIFITGVTPLTMDSLTSGFNIKKNLTTRDTLNEMMGFTEEETGYIVKEVLKDCGQEDKFEEVYDTMKRYYNGYKFNEEADKRLFNSDMVLYYLTEYQQNCKQPKNMLDTNIASDYSKMKNLFLLIKERKDILNIITKLINGEDIKAELTEEFSLEKEFDQYDLISLLYYMGLITIRGSIAGILKLEIPNYVIKKLYYEYFENYISNLVRYEVDRSEVTESLIEMAEGGKVEGIVKIVENFLKAISNRDFIKFDERYIKFVFLMYLMGSDIYYVESEGEIGRGYVDIRLEGREIFDIKYNYVLEIKYLKAGAREGEVAEAVERGVEQLSRYREGMLGKVRGYDRYKYYVIVFKNVECVKIEEVE